MDSDRNNSVGKSANKSGWSDEKMPSAYEALFDSGYSSTALSVHSSSSIFQSRNSVDFESEFQDKLSLQNRETDSGLCIDSGLSIGDSYAEKAEDTIVSRSVLSHQISEITQLISKNCNPFNQDDDGDT